MRKRQNFASLVLLFCVAILVLTTGLTPRKTGARFQKKEIKEEEDFSRFPIVDFDAPEPDDPAIQASRNTKGRRYGMGRRVAKISEKTDRIVSLLDWEAGLPALPVSRSVAVVIGRIIDSEANVTPDKTAIYSEFKINVETVVKNDPENTFDVGRNFIIERSGGRVRMPSGKIIVSWVKNQNMPRLEGRYVLFLTHSFETLGDMGKDFYILTGYELKDGHVFLLDNTLPGHPITAYKGAAESVFLNDLFASLTKDSATKQR